MSRNSALEALLLLLRPVVRFGLRRSLSIHDFEKMLKVALVDVAEEELKKVTPKLNVSRISVMTGIYRVEVTKLFKERLRPSDEPLSVSGRTLSVWESDKRYQTKNGTPKVLTEDEFHQLVEQISQAISPATVLFDLERSRAIQHTSRGWQLVRATSSTSSDETRGFEFLSHDLETLIAAAEDNIFKRDQIGHLHHRTAYDNIFQKDLAAAQTWVLREGRRFHEKVRHYLSRYDKDMNPQLGKNQPGGGKIVVSSFSFTSEKGIAEPYE